jgi:tetratricopeptide (TPR) repeat protein
MEAFFFASGTGDQSLLARVRPHFSEQLDALGWTLSYEHKQFDAAAEVFAQALRWNADDDYAHHYRAYNLDRLGVQRSQVEEHYATAVELNPEHVWWHSRLISFLVTQGRVDEARQRWDDAEYALGIADGEGDAFLYETLHGWVMSTLLHRGELAFAREVLDDVPDWARSEAAGFGSLERRLEALYQAHELGAFVPAQRLKPKWWTEGPSLLQDRLGDDRRLIRWLAGRVERVDQDGVTLRAAEVAPGQRAAPRVAWTTIDLDEFDAMCRDAEPARSLLEGRHVEIGVYAGGPNARELGPETLIRVHALRDWDDLEAPRMDSARYLRRQLR